MSYVPMGMRDEQEQEEVGSSSLGVKILGASVLAILALAAFLVYGPSLRQAATNSTDKTITSTNPGGGTGTKTTDIRPGFKRFNANSDCEPERDGVVDHLDEVLQVARKTNAIMPVQYIKERVGRLIEAIDAGTMCLQSEQLAPDIESNTFMMISSGDGRHGHLTFFLSHMRQGEEDFPTQVEISMTHEYAHTEQKGEESNFDIWASHEANVRRQVCSGGVEPLSRDPNWSSGVAGYIYECGQIRTNAEAWEQALRESYREKYRRYHNDR